MLNREVRAFNRAVMPADLGLAEADFPFTLHRAGCAAVKRGPLKAEARARAKYEDLPGGATAWPPLAAKKLLHFRDSPSAREHARARRGSLAAKSE